MSSRDHLRRWYQHRKTRFRFNEANPTHTRLEFSISTKLYNNLCYAYAGIERKDLFVDMYDTTRSITFVIANTRRWIMWIEAQLVVYVGTIPMSRILVIQIYFVFNRPHPLWLNLEVNWSLEGRIIAFEILSLLKFSNKKDGWKYGMLE